MRARLLDLSVQMPDAAGQTPEALRLFVADEIDKWVPIIRNSGVTAQ